MLELLREFLPLKAGLHRLPVDAWHRIFIEHDKRWHAVADRGGKVGRGELFEIKLNHHVFGDLPALDGPILQPVEAVLHFGNAGLEPGGQGLIGQGRPDNRL